MSEGSKGSFKSITNDNYILFIHVYDRTPQYDIISIQLWKQVNEDEKFVDVFPRFSKNSVFENLYHFSDIIFLLSYSTLCIRALYAAFSELRGWIKK